PSPGGHGGDGQGCSAVRRDATFGGLTPLDGHRNNVNATLIAPAIQADTTLYERVSRRDVTAPDSGSRRGPRPFASLVRGRRAGAVAKSAMRIGSPMSSTKTSPPRPNALAWSTSWTASGMVMK